MNTRTTETSKILKREMFRRRCDATLSSAPYSLPFRPTPSPHLAGLFWFNVQQTRTWNRTSTHRGELSGFRSTNPVDLIDSNGHSLLYSTHRTVNTYTTLVSSPTPSRSLLLGPCRFLTITTPTTSLDYFSHSPSHAAAVPLSVNMNEPSS